MRMIVLLPFVVAVAACGGSSDSSHQTGSPAPNAPTSVDGTVDTSGAQISLPGAATVTFPANAVNGPTSVEVSKSTDQDLLDTFSDSDVGWGLVSAEAYAIKIDLATTVLSSDSTSIKVQVSDSLAALANGGQTIVAFAKSTDISDDADSGESLDVNDPITGQYDSTAHTLTVTLPSVAFNPGFAGDGHTAAIVRVAVLPDDNSTGAVVNVSRAATTSVSACPGDASFSAPLLYGWRQAADGQPSLYYDAIAGVVAPFAEPRSYKNAKGNPTTNSDGSPKLESGHQGIDLFADEGTPVFAVSDGYIETVKSQNYSCSAAGPRVKAKTVPYPEFTATIALTDANGKVTGRAIYRHLTFDSVYLQDSQGVVRDSKFQQCWQAQTNADRLKYHVKKGDRIASSGATGMLNATAHVPPHLHFEWVPGNLSSKATANPLCKLATFFPGRVDPNYAAANQAEISERLYVQPAPGTVDFNGNAETLAEIWVRRNKPNSAAPIPPVCQVSGGASPCDWGGHGYFMYSLDNPIAGSNWPTDSVGQMAVQVYISSDNRFSLPVSTTYAPDGAQPTERATPPPTTTYSYLNTSSGQTNGSCGFSAKLTYSVELWADRFRKARQQFDPFTATATATVPAGSPPGNCSVSLTPG